MIKLEERKIKIARVSTVPFFIDTQLRVQLKELIEGGFDITAIASEGDWERLKKINGLKCMIIPITRAPAIVKDIISIYRLFKYFRKQQFDIVHSTTPKAGLVSVIASRIAGINICLHTFTGQTWSTRKGVSRFFLKQIDKFILKLATQCYADSETQKQFLIKEGVGTEECIKVLGLGSLAGIDITRFNDERWQAERAGVKSQLGIPDSDFVLTFIGRVNRDKGIYELLEAFQSLNKKYNDIQLLIVGPLEDKSLFSAELKNVHFVGKTRCPEKYMSITNILCLPSYREGFGTVVMEAAAMRVPTLGTDIVGLRDAVQHNKTGVLVNPRCSESIRVGLESLLLNRMCCQSMGEAAFQRCIDHFSSEKLTHLLSLEYKEYINK